MGPTFIGVHEMLEPRSTGCALVDTVARPSDVTGRAPPRIPSGLVEPSSSDRTLEIERVAGDGPVRLRLRGELDAHSAPDLEAALAPAAADAASVEIDLREVSFVDSSGLAALLEGRSRLDGAGGSLRVTGASEAAERLFAMTGVGPHLMGT